LLRHNRDAPATQQNIPERPLLLDLDMAESDKLEQGEECRDEFAALNARVPAVGVVPPSGWQPSREGVQIYQEIQQRLIQATIAQQQQAAAAAAQQGNPVATDGR
jgi:hypothetical protein